MFQVHLWRAEEKTSHPGHPPTAVPEGSRPDCGSQGGELLIHKYTRRTLTIDQQPSHKASCKNLPRKQKTVSPFSDLPQQASTSAIAWKVTYNLDLYTMYVGNENKHRQTSVFKCLT